jgi:hypothetical protein
MLASPAPIAAQEKTLPNPHPTLPPPALDASVLAAQPITWSAAALFLAGGAAAFVTHETCHFLANLGTGNQPSLEPVNFLGFIPFVAIVPSIRCRNGECRKHNGEDYYAGRPGLYTIVSAGLQCQHYEDEFILSLRPGLRMDRAPFRKGMLTFNTLTSIGYVIANWTGVEPVDGDVRGIHRDGGAPRILLSTLVLGIAVVDIARYYFPQARWLAWLNRAAKLSVTGVAFTM